MSLSLNKSSRFIHRELRRYSSSGFPLGTTGHDRVVRFPFRGLLTDHGLLSLESKDRGTRTRTKHARVCPTFRGTRFYLLVFRSSFSRLTRLRRTKPPRKLCLFFLFFFFFFLVILNAVLGYTRDYVHGEKNLFLHLSYNLNVSAHIVP